MRQNGFHTDTFGMLENTPAISEEAITAIEQVEHRLGLKLPASVREWYAQEGALEILARHSNDDPPVPFDEFGTIECDQGTFLPFKDENQYVCSWAICIDGSDDPPVYVSLDDDRTKWQLATPTFSTYVRVCVWDYQFLWHQAAYVSGVNSVLSSHALDTLASSFSCYTPSKIWMENTQYRFYDDKVAILIWSDDQAWWHIAAVNTAWLEETLTNIWNLDNIGKALDGCSEQGEAVLATIRSQCQS